MQTQKGKETDITSWLFGILVLLIGVLVIRSTTLLTNTQTSTNSRASEVSPTIAPTLTAQQEDEARDNWCKTHVPLNVNPAKYDASKDYCFYGDVDYDEEGRVCGTTAVREIALQTEKPGTAVDEIVYTDKTTPSNLTCGTALNQFRPGSRRCCRHVTTETLQPGDSFSRRENNKELGDSYCKYVLSNSSAVCMKYDWFTMFGDDAKKACQLRHGLPISSTRCAQIERSFGVASNSDSLVPGVCCGQRQEKR